MSNGLAAGAAPRVPREPQTRPGKCRVGLKPAAPGLHERLSVSMGIAGRPAHGSTAEELLEAADAGLVRAKNQESN
jgi:GGDEF domain-containing protein